MKRTKLELVVEIVEPGFTLSEGKMFACGRLYTIDEQQMFAQVRLDGG